MRHAERETARKIVAGFDYRDPLIKRALWELKYKGRKRIARALGRALYDRTLEDLADIRMFSMGAPILVIPIPLSKHRARERGYNQAQLIAKYFIEQNPQLFELEINAIVKIKDTPPQARIVNRNKRLKNIAGAFSFNPKYSSSLLSGRTIIVLDDITTTGGTLHEAMKVLEKSGAKKVIGFAVAH